MDLPEVLFFNDITGKSWLTGDTTLVLSVIAFIACTQVALTMLQFKALLKWPLALVTTIIFGGTYGFSVHFIALVMAPMAQMHPLPLNLFHWLGLIVLVAFWLIMLFGRNSAQIMNLSPWLPRGYVAALNASQPHPATITAYRNHYHC